MFSNDSRRTCLRWLVVAMAIGMAGGGLAALAAHTYEPGKPTSATQQWPGQSSLTLSDQTLTAVLFVHPLCPCTRVAMDELLSFASEYEVAWRVEVVFVIPEEMSPQWQQHGHWSFVAGEPFFQAHVDVGGQEAKLFGAKTSGHFFAFDRHGSKLFDGGLTNGRGHAGPSAGLNSLAQLVCELSPGQKTAPVYGCPLQNP
ncbi:MAG: hypothetical protein IT423_15515 [Pirellulaceae bacterium]|nr:hypothetical protein [Pirellulaceae bacterium]